MEATEADTKQLFFVLKLALSRAVSACVPDSDLDDIKRVALSLECVGDLVSITGLLLREDASSPRVPRLQF